LNEPGKRLDATRQWSFPSLPNAGRPIESAGYQFMLLGMQENRPFVPRKFQGALQFLDVCHHTETALCVRVFEGICYRSDRLRDSRLPTSGQFQQGFGCFRRQPLCQQQQAVFVRLFDIPQPFGGDAVAEQFVAVPDWPGSSGDQTPSSAPLSARLR
jgi:hypothetical protein